MYLLMTDLPLVCVCENITHRPVILDQYHMAEVTWASNRKMRVNSIFFQQSHF